MFQTNLDLKFDFGYNCNEIRKIFDFNNISMIVAKV